MTHHERGANGTATHPRPTTHRHLRHLHAAEEHPLDAAPVGPHGAPPLPDFPQGSSPVGAPWYAPQQPGEPVGPGAGLAARGSGLAVGALALAVLALLGALTPDAWLVGAGTAVLAGLLGAVALRVAPERSVARLVAVAGVAVAASAVLADVVLSMSS